jgi:hypothetical protein
MDTDLQKAQALAILVDKEIITVEEARAEIGLSEEKQGE